MITHCASFSQWVGRCVGTCASFSLLWSFKVLIHSFFLLLNFDPSFYFIFSFTLLVLLRLNKCLLCKQASFRSHVFPLKTNFSYYFLLTIHIDDTFKVNEKKNHLPARQYSIIQNLSCTIQILQQLVLPCFKPRQTLVRFTERVPLVEVHLNPSKFFFYI